MSIVTDLFLPLALAFIMFALGLGLTGADFLRVAKQPKDFFIGTIMKSSKGRFNPADIQKYLKKIIRRWMISLLKNLMWGHPVFQPGFGLLLLR